MIFKILFIVCASVGVLTIYAFVKEAMKTTGQEVQQLLDKVEEESKDLIEPKDPPKAS